jgi:hypothetical protein
MMHRFCYKEAWGRLDHLEDKTVFEREIAPAEASDEAVAATRASTEAGATLKWKARQELARHRAETERLRVLVDFLARPIHAHGGAEPDPDIVTAYNLAVEAALQEVRRAALGECTPPGTV